MSTVAERVRGRVDVSLPTLGLFAGDLAAIGMFVVLGVTSHGGDPGSEFGRVAGTFAPFLLGWLIASVPAGVYDRRIWTAPRRVAVRVLAAWFVADAVAQLLRATSLFRGGGGLRPALVFGTVAFLVGGTLLLGWRVAVAALSSRRERAPA